jgi:hypothetical protein
MQQLPGRTVLDAGTPVCEFIGSVTDILLYPLSPKTGASPNAAQRNVRRIDLCDNQGEKGRVS